MRRQVAEILLVQLSQRANERRGFAQHTRCETVGLVFESAGGARFASGVNQNVTAPDSNPKSRKAGAMFPGSNPNPR